MEPNLREMSTSEAAELALKATELEELGKFEEAENLLMQLPILPGIADNLKHENGIQYLIDKQYNLSSAIKEYGYEWLNS
jgi:hypothetical protein